MRFAELVDLNVSFSITTPADAMWAIAVGSVNSDGVQRSDFSSIGPTGDSRIKPDVVRSHSFLDPFNIYLVSILTFALASPTMKYIYPFEPNHPP